MEDLTKQQLVLLTVLVSMVCSIATSVSVVALLTDTQPVVTQTINSIVEKTIEKVVPGAVSPIIVKDTKPTVILSENEKMINAVQENLGKIVVIRERNKEGVSATSTDKIGIGTVVGLGGLIVVDSYTMGERTECLVFVGNKYRTAKKVFSDNALHIIFLQVDDVIKDDKNTEGINFNPVAYYIGDITLGLPLIALGGENGKSILRGNVSEIPDEKSTTIGVGDMNIPLSYRGGVVFGLDGKVVGIILSVGNGVSSVVRSTALQSLISEYKNSQPNQVKS